MHMYAEDILHLTISKLKPHIDRALEVRRKNFSNKVHFYFPAMVHFESSFYKTSSTLHFPGISVTGPICKLGCEHCKGKLLVSMLPATTPEDLLNLCCKLKKDGAEGLLLTGGCLENGTIPLKKFLPAIKTIKHELGLKVVVHVGLVDEELAEGLASADIDAAMIDVVGSDETIKRVLKLNKEVRDCESSLYNLSRYSVPTVPHVVVGIHYGLLKGEVKALELISKYEPKAVVVVALMPLEGTPMEKVHPPEPIDVMRVVLTARLLMPKTPILFGCAKPRGLLRSAMDVLALRVGANGIAYPSEEAYRFAKRLGFEVVCHESCCSLLWKDLLMDGEVP